MATYYLTERAAIHLRDIYTYTVDQWGEKQAERYMQGIIRHLQKIAANPEIGKMRRNRSMPFLMAVAEKHYVIYRECEEGIIVASLLHSKRDIESIIQQIGLPLALEIQEIERQIH